MIGSLQKLVLLQKLLAVLDLTAHIASNWPNLLDGPYETRMETLRSLNLTTGSVLDRKSRRLQKLMPEQVALDEIKNGQEGFL